MTLILRPAVLAIATLALAWLLTTSATVTAQPVPTELDRLCVNRYTGQLRYLAPNRSCATAEREIHVLDDLPYTLCVNRYTRVVRYSPSGACTASERAFPLPDSLPMSFCVNRYTTELRWRSAAQSCPTGSFNAAISQVEPVAVDDGPHDVNVGENLNVEAPGLLTNDALGFPVAAIVSFGIATASEQDAGMSLLLAGGTLTVNANGSFSLVGPDEPGEYTFQYRLENDAGFDEATVTLQVLGPPLAVDDGPDAESAPGDLFHTAFNTQLNSSPAENLLANDELGFPLAELDSFGGGDLGGDVDDFAAGTTVMPLPGHDSGALTVNADGSFVFTPPEDFTGLFSFDYRLENISGASDATVVLAVGTRPDAQDDAYAPTVLGNVFIDTSLSSEFSVLDNDAGDGLAFTDTDLTSANGGDVTLDPDGAFSYDPPPGFEGSDSFVYEIDNGFGDPRTGTVSLTVEGMIWFVDASAGPDGDGRLSAPFDCLVGPGCFDPTAADDAGDSIFLASGEYTGGLSLLANQLFVGEGTTDDLSTITGLTPPADSPSLPAANGARPTITTTNADALILGDTNLIRGMNVGNTGTGAGISGSGFGTLTVSEVVINGTGRAVNLETGTADVTIDSIVSNTGGAQGINLDGVSGTFTVTGATTINSTNGHGIAINASPATVAFQDTVTIDTTGTNGIHLTGNTNGPITFASIDLDFIGSVGLRIQNNDNPVTVNGGSIGATSGPGGNAVDIDGGTADITVAASVSKTSGGDVVNVAGRFGGIATFSGTISCTGACSGIDVIDNGGGEEHFTGAATVNTGAMTAVNIVNNGGGHLVSFSGGLDVDTTSGTAFNASNGGRIAVLDDGVANTVDSTTGTAVNIVDTTIAMQGVTFERVSANGAPNGIVLTNTGTQGGFTVTGIGSTDGSGGTIQNITNRGVEAISTQDLDLNNMNFVNAGTTNGADPLDAFSDCGDVGTGTTTGCNSAVHVQSSTGTTLNNLHITGGAQIGISGANITGLTIADTVVQEVGNQLRESALKLFGLAGTVSITDSVFDGGGAAAGGPERAGWIGNAGSEILSLTITNSTFRDTQDAQSPPDNNIGADGLEIVHFGTATSTIAIIDSQFLRNRTNGLQVFAQANSDVAIDITGSTFNPGTGEMIGMDLAAAGNGTLNFNVIGNPVIYSNGGSAVNIFAIDMAFIQGRINDNPDIQVGGPSTSGTGIAVQVNETARGIVEIDNNTISNIGFDAGIQVISRLRGGAACGTGCTDGRLDATITNNIVTVADDGGLYDIWVQANDSNTICANVEDNTTSGTGDAAFRARTNAAESTMLLEGFDTDATTTWNNNGNTPAGSVSESHNGALAGGTCTVPANPLP